MRVPEDFGTSGSGGGFPLSHHVWGIGGDNVGSIQSTKAPKERAACVREGSVRGKDSER